MGEENDNEFFNTLIVKFNKIYRYKINNFAKKKLSRLNCI